MRFPEFEGEWIEKKFAEVGQFFKGTGISKDKLTKEGNPCILYGELYTKYKNEVITEVFSKTDINEKGLVYSKANDIIIPSSGESAIDIATACCVNLNDVLLGGDLNIIRPYKDNGNFISYQLNGKLKFEIAKIAQGSSVTHLYNESLKKLHVKIPVDITEQNKIATLLSVIDDRVQTQNKIIQRLESSIRILRENIFTQIYRFKDCDGHDFPDWQYKKLEDIAMKKSSNVAANKIEENSGEYIIYGASGILKRVDFYAEESDYISIVKDGAGVGRLFYCEGKSSVLGTMDIIKPFDGINIYFLFCLLSTIDFTKYITGSTIPHIYFKDYKNEIFGIPCIEEQERIASSLFAIYTKMQIEKAAIEVYENQKRYLLRNLFI